MPSKKKNKNKKTFSGSKEGTANAQTQTLQFAPQPDSQLLQLPRELRDRVFHFLFLSTRVTFGERSTGRIGRKNMKPAAHSLAVLGVCRQVYEEAKSLWVGRVLFNFEHVESLLDKLSPLPSSVLSQIRHVRTRGHTLMLSFEDGQDVYYRLAWALKLLPGLRLDTLTVLGSSDGIVDYDTLAGLVEHGNGWKELHYITQNSTMLGFKKMDIFMADPYWRRPQPSTWNESLLSRDGADSKATVTVYQATENKTIGIPFNTTNSRTLIQKVVPPETLESFGMEEDLQLMSQSERGKELLVVVKRGRAAKIGERDGPPYHSLDIRLATGDKSWQKIKRKYIELDGRYDDWDDDFFRKEETFEADTYRGVHEYVWDDTVSF